MSDALDLLGARLATTALGLRGFTLERHGDAIGFAHDGVDTGLRAVVRLVRVPSLRSLLVEGRWVEVTVAPSALAEASHPTVLLVVDDAGDGVWATREEVLARLAPGAASEAQQVRLSALSGAAGFGLHRLFLTLAATRVAPALGGDAPASFPDSMRLRLLLRRLLDDGDGFDAPRADLAALGVPPWLLAAFTTEGDVRPVTLTTPPYAERLAVELRGPFETLAARACAMRCARGGAARSTWVAEPGAGPLGLSLRLDHARNTLELRVSLLGAPSTAAALAAAARFVWRFEQGGRVALTPCCGGAGLTVESAVARQPPGAVTHEVVETLSRLAAIERATGVTFVVDPAALADATQAEAIRELLLLWSSARAEQSASSMRLSLTGDEVRRMLDGSGHQRRVSLRLPPSRASHAVLGASVALGTRVREVTGTLAQPPDALAAAAGTLAPDERLDVDLSAVEVRDLYEPASPGATTTGRPAARGAPSGSRSGST